MNEKYVKEGRTKQKLSTRDKILENAHYYLQKGEVFTLEDVAKRANISRATIYRYYSSIDILAGEAGLHISARNPEHVYQENADLEFNSMLANIQDYYNNLALDHENAFRKYLSVAIAKNATDIKRGARRVKTLELAVKDANIPETDKKRLAHLLTVLMGVEPIIVTKDVCNLNNTESKDLLAWGMQLILKGLQAEHSEQG